MQGSTFKLWKLHWYLPKCYYTWLDLSLSIIVKFEKLSKQPEGLIEYIL